MIESKKEIILVNIDIDYIVECKCLETRYEANNKNYL